MGHLAAAASAVEDIKIDLEEHAEFQELSQELVPIIDQLHHFKKINKSTAWHCQSWSLTLTLMMALALLTMLIEDLLRLVKQ